MHPKIAQAIYFSLQYLRREPVLRVLRELERSQWFSRDELQDLQWRKMKRIVAYAYENVTFYRKLYEKHGIHPEDIKTHRDINSLPITDRKMLQENLGDLMGRKGASYPSRTAGTTGESLKLQMDNMSWAYHHANIFRTLSWFGVEPRAPEARIWGRRIDLTARKKMLLKDYLFNRLRINAFDIDREALPYARKLLRFKPHFIYGYPSAIVHFAERIKLSNTNFPSIKVVACSAEQLTVYQREMIEGFFNVKVTDIYGAAEVGIIASQCPLGGRHIPAESIWIDIENEQEFSSGQKTGDIILTDLNNFTMPIIRYSIGDRGILEPGICACGRGLPLLGDFNGRTLEFIETQDGRKVNSAMIYYLFKGLEARGARVKQYQLVQKKPDYFCIKILRQDQLKESDRRYLVETLKYYVGENIKVLVEEVNSIPPSASGKYQIFIRDTQ